MTPWSVWFDCLWVGANRDPHGLVVVFFWLEWWTETQTGLPVRSLLDLTHFDFCCDVFFCCCVMLLSLLLLVLGREHCKAETL